MYSHSYSHTTSCMKTSKLGNHLEGSRRSSGVFSNLVFGGRMLYAGRSICPRRRGCDCPVRNSCLMHQRRSL